MKEAINSSILHSDFPNNANVLLLHTPLDKGTKDKNSINNYRPVSVLNFFSKFYEKVIKQQIISFIDSTTMDKNNEKNDKFYRKVAFLMYTEMANFRPQS